jgi:hypothetical protein
MPIKPVDRQKLICEYIEAFRMANPDSKVPIVAYVRRFYRFKMCREDEWEMRKYRHRDMQRMLRSLLAAVGKPYPHT